MSKVCRWSSALALLALLASSAVAQEMPKPAPEHALLKADVGTWDASMEMWLEPGKPPVASQGVEVVSMLGEFWQVGAFKSTFMGQPFEGHGLTGWDAQKKKYVSAWVDSSAPGLTHGESTYDAATRTMTGLLIGPGPDGAMQKMKQTVVWKGADERVFTMANLDAGGKETVSMRITYKRRK